MTGLLRLLLPLCLLLSLAPTESDPGFDTIATPLLMAHVRFLASDDLEGRAPGSEGGELAAAYMVQRFEGLRLKPAGTAQYRQPFQKGKRKLANVVALLEGSDAKLRSEYVVIGAHYDHVGKIGDRIFNGADDNASGCAALVETAHALCVGDRPRRSLLFVAFDGEEIGCVGSRHFLENPPVPKQNIVAMLNLDMVGRGETGDLRVCGTPHSKQLARIVESAAPRVELKLYYDHERAWRHASDHGPFGDARIPFLYFGVLDHADYHRPTDTWDRINTEKLTRITRLTYLTARAIANATERPTFHP